MRRLTGSGLIDHGHGWIARTGRTPRRIAYVTTESDERRRRRIARHRAERDAFWAIVTIIHANYTAREIRGYTSPADVHADTEDYLRAALPHARTRPHLPLTGRDTRSQPVSDPTNRTATS
ncbi:hypothetical protein [Nocardia sp. NPDC057227]|uniref:hypothetical protein n=1 Tax=Nocardia sp. NPDC057227 TaxID=3346056 RepID=UPI00363A4134